MSLVSTDVHNPQTPLDHITLATLDEPTIVWLNKSLCSIPVNRWILLHFASGVAMRVVGLSAWWALGLHLLFEGLEIALANFKVDCAEWGDTTIDTLAAMAGFGLAHLFIYSINV